jgi:hypothetical protein
MRPIQTTRCKKCKEKIFFIKTEKKKRLQPFDVKPEMRMVMVNNPDPEAPQGEQLARMITTFMPHHATCPYAEEFRKSHVLE